MGGTSIWHWLVLGVVAMIFLGRGRFSDMMGDVAKGIKSFKKGMAEDDSLEAAPKQIDAAKTTLEAEKLADKQA